MDYFFSSLTLHIPKLNVALQKDPEGNRASGSGYESDNDDNDQQEADEEEDAQGAEYENDEMTATVLVEEIDMEAGDLDEQRDTTRHRQSDDIGPDKKKPPVIAASSGAGGGEGAAKKRKRPEKQRLKQSLQQKRALRKPGARPKKSTKAKR
jgi:hypothetical protein